VLDWITALIEKSGYLGIAALMLAENVFPPIPSELIMPLAGYNAARGELSLVGAVLAGSLGSIAGAFLWFGLGYWLGCEKLKRIAGRHGRWLTLTPGDIDDADAWFDRHGGKAVFLGRLVPGVRTLISVPAGVAHMSLSRFLTYSILGTVAWTAILAAAGFALGEQYQQVSGTLDPIANAVVVGLVIAYFYRVTTFQRRVRRKESAKPS
jgi:membrane protein DedA with SNARE-associated domain